MLATTESSACWSRAASTTDAPARANARAVAAPIPRLAPATSATVPANVSVCRSVWVISISMLWTDAYDDCENPDERPEQRRHHATSLRQVTNHPSTTIPGASNHSEAYP
jgi:hypothetical protein